MSVIGESYPHKLKTSKPAHRLVRRFWGVLSEFAAAAAVHRAGGGHVDAATAG